MSDLRVALVGAGGIAQTWVSAFARATSVRLAAVVDVRAEAAAALAEPVGVPAFAAVGELVAAGVADAAVVCTPPVTHVDLVDQLAAAGLHVICEKPLALDLAGARKMIATAEASGAVLTMASKYRFAEDVIRARSIVTSGMLGEIVMFSNTFASHVDMRNRWNADPAVSGGGVIIDNGTHSVDIARYLFGPVAQTLAVPGRPVQHLGVEDSARLLLRMDNGALGTVQLSWSWETAANTYLEVVGTDAVLRVGWSRSRFKQRGSPHWVEYGNGYDKVGAHAKQLEVLAAAVRGDGELLITPADALASVAAIEAAYTSVAEDRWVPVDPLP
jgi:predicted dehydrogenase